MNGWAKPRLTIGPVIAAILLFPLTACLTADRPGGWAGTFRDSAGIFIVENPEYGMWGDTEGWTLAEDLRIGTFGGDLDYQFGQVGAIALNSRGEVFVSDTQAQEVRVFSPDGTYLRTVGGPGSGPGELGRAAPDIFITVGDTLLVPDPSNRRINRYGPDGGTLASAPLNPGRERPLRYRQNAVRDMAVQLRPVRSPNRPDPEPMDAIVRMTPSGTFGDTLLEVPSGGLFEGGGIHYFTPEPMWTLTDSLKVLYGVNSEYRIGVYGRNGSLERVITKPFEPTPIGDRDIRALFSFLDRAWLEAGVPPSRLAENHSNVHFAEFFPAYFTFHTGPGGSLWVQRIRPPGDLSEGEMAVYNFQEDFGSPHWDVFDREGRYLGVVEMPRRFQPRQILEDKIYGVWRDDLDVQYVIRLRVLME